MAGGEGDLACSGDLLLASLAACQEITVRMVAAAMGIVPETVEVTVEGDLDVRGTMGVDPETPVGFTAIRSAVRLVAATLRQPPTLETTITTEGLRTED